MSVFLQPIYTQTIGNSTTTEITFNNIPQSFTDLKMVVSGRDISTSGINGAVLGFKVNGDASTNNLYSATALKGTGSGTTSDRATSAQFFAIPYITNPSYTSNTFASIEFYLPNYTGSNFKSWTIDGVTENNATAANQILVAGLYRSTSAVTSVSFYDAGGSYYFAQTNTTFTLYGITKG